GRPAESARRFLGLLLIPFCWTVRTNLRCNPSRRSGAIAQLHHPAASHELPSFIAGPGETDVLMVVMSLFLVVAVVTFGIVFLRLHTLPERMAHKSQKIQFEIVAILG